MKDAAVRKALDRTILAIYLLALTVLMTAPISGSGGLRLLGIAADKWVHFGLFCGLGALLRWNLAASRHPWMAAALASIAVGVLTEAAQGVIAYRSASWSDLYADLAGTVLGVVAMTKIISLPRPEKVAGATVMLLGLGVAGLFVLADLIGLGNNQGFGPTQLSGTLLGILVAAGGAGIFVLGRPPPRSRAT